MYIVKCQDQQTCSIAHGMLNNEVPIIVFQTEKLNRTSNQSSPKVTSLPGSIRVRAVHFGQEDWTIKYQVLLSTMCGSRKYPYPNHRGSLEMPRGRGGLKAKIFKGKYQPKLEFPGFKPKNPPWGEYGYFLNKHNALQLVNSHVLNYYKESLSTQVQRVPANCWGKQR